MILDRRLQQDDNRGLGQGVTDNKLTGSLYHLLLEDRRAVQVRAGVPDTTSVCLQLGFPALFDQSFSFAWFHFFQQEVGGATIDHLSLLAHLESLSLCHPPIIMFAQSDIQLPKLRPFLPLHSSLPCDVHLLNLRTLEAEEVRSTPEVQFSPPLRHHHKSVVLVRLSVNGVESLPCVPFSQLRLFSADSWPPKSVCLVVVGHEC